ncbi:hypothetical protein [Rhodobacter sp. CZR27]|uniref:hypothetical protein n=1 Tax=Rhodobacter sp. CZR27 TaxID=2033869 RepID=UPI000BBF30E4|nr:hypothetical protein [Rhodobacter sp. CZR27]
MSLFARILSRAAVSGLPAVPLAHPKGRLGTLSRLEEPEREAGETPLSPLYRAMQEEEEAQPLRRAAPRAEEEEEEEPVRRTAEGEEEEPIQAQRDLPPDEEEALQPLRRAAAPPEEDEEEPVARSLAPDDEEEEARPLRPLLRRAPPGPEEDEEEPVARLAPDADELEPRTSPKPAWLSAEPEPEPLLTLRREAASPVPAVAGPSGGPAVDADMAALPPAEPLWSPAAPFQPPTPLTGPASVAERPRVVIEQIDVTIHEPSAPATGMDASALSRALRSRYLGGM